MSTSTPVSDVRVLVVEDHPVLRGVVRLACEHTPGLALAGEVGTGEEAVEACRELHPDVVVLDLSLPGALQGLDVARAVRAEGTAGRLLVLTGRSDEEAVFDAIKAGADGFLEKTAGVRFIADALLRVGAGERVFTPEQEGIAVAELGRLARQARESSGVRASLTDRELEILELVSRGLTVKQVASRLGLSPRTVETHIAKLYRKLGVRNRVQAVSKAAALGLVELS
ncbi:MAG: response regulator [Solirubrobacterales bacterium]|jgi:DNA-binding NarL/FixJ family response regulator